MYKERDSQRERLYVAENRVRKKHGRQFKTEAELREYVDSVVSSTWWREQGYAVPTILRINFRKSGRFARGGGWKNVMAGWVKFDLTFPRWAMHEIIVLHELSHAVVMCQPGGGAMAWHGYEFSQVLLNLVGHFVSVDAKLMLRAEFDRERVNMGERALELKEQGWSWAEINERFGYAKTGSGARAAANRALAAKRQQS